MTREDITREEALKELKEYEDGLDMEYATPFDKAILYAIKALEQEPILDKIRAEMFEEMISHSGTGEEVIQAYADGLKKGLEFIDKYKAEIKPQESEET